jgi:hypothetical protein
VAVGTPPFITDVSPERIVVHKGWSVTLEASATDLELGKLSYRWSAKDGQITSTEDDGRIAIWKAPEEAGVYEVAVHVSDPTEREAEMSIKLEVVDLFQLMVNGERLSSTTVEVGDSISLNLTASSSSYSSLKYSWAALDYSGQVVSSPSPSDSPSATWRPLKYGNYTLSVTVENTTYEEKDTKSLIVTVLPRFLLGTTVLTVGGSLSIEVATDASSDGALYSAESGLSYSWSGEHVTPEANLAGSARFRPLAFGEYPIAVALTDSSARAATISTTIVVEPRLIVPKAILGAGEVVALECIASVPGATSSITYAWEASSKTSSTAGSFSATNGRTTGWTAPNSPGIYAVTVRVAREGNQTMAVSVGLEVAEGWGVLNHNNLKGLSNDRIGAILVSGDTLWMGTGEGLFKVSLSGDSPTIVASYNTSTTANGSITNNQISAVELDRNGDLWVGTSGGGLFKAEISKGDSWTWQKFTLTRNTVPFNSLTSLIADKDGNIWAGTDGGGVFRYDSLASSFPDATVSALATGNGTIWSAMGSASTTDKTVISQLSISSTNSWTGMHSTYDINTDFVSSFGVPSDPAYVDQVAFVVGALAFSGSDLWATVQKWEHRKLANSWGQVAGGGVSRYNGSKWIAYKTAGSNVASDSVKVIKADSKGRIWVGTNDGGISMFDGTSWITYNADNSPLPINIVLTIFIDSKDNVWVGTVSGLAKIKAP